MSTTQFKWAELIVNILGTLITSGAFWVTYKTLKEMQKQTKIASNPILKIRVKAISTHPKKVDFQNPKFNERYDTWLTIVRGYLTHDISSVEDKFLIIEFTNSGKSEIVNIKFTMRLSISMFDNQSELNKFDINPVEDDWEEEIEVELVENEKVTYLVTNTRYFPVYELDLLNISYKDVRKSAYLDYEETAPTINEENNILMPR